MKARPFTAIHIIPTGVGASIGGFAGDAGPANRLISSCVDYLIANPNVVNAATLHNIPDNLIYTEGYSLDSFCKGNTALRIKQHKKIGVVFDSGIPESSLNININAINACKTVYGSNVIGYIITDKPVKVEFSLTENNFSTGTIGNPETLLKSCASIIEKGAEAIAVVCMFPDDNEEDLYSAGQGADPVGGVEAIISHLITSEFNIPCAHAPAFSYKTCLPSKIIVDPRTAAEYFSPTFLPCVIAGLNKAPQLIEREKAKSGDLIIDDISILVTPYNCLGSVPVIACIEKNISIIAIKNNSCVLDVTAKKLDIESQVIELENYLEATGYIIAIREGISPQSVRRPIQNSIGI